jgi:hypothetical protein
MFILVWTLQLLAMLPFAAPPTEAKIAICFISHNNNVVNIAKRPFSLFLSPPPCPLPPVEI